MRCSVPEDRSEDPMLTVDKPRDLQELMRRLLFSIFVSSQATTISILDVIAGKKGGRLTCHLESIHRFRTSGRCVGSRSSLCL